MPQLQPFFYLQELGSVVLILTILTLVINYYFLPTLSVIHCVRRYLTSL